MRESKTREIYTVGHSTHSLEEFIKILRSFKIETLVDVRRYPGSRKFPHFNKDHLQGAIPETGIEYIHLEDLGGRRKSKKDSINTVWRLLSFRGYADYMETPSFNSAVGKLEEIALTSRVAYMCSEAVWWSCHRSMISDFLKVNGFRVIHIMGEGKSMEHPYTKPAKVVKGKLKYGSEN